MVVVTADFGPNLIPELGRLIDGARRGNKLGPGLVICSNGRVALGVRRQLGGLAGGTAGLTIISVDQFVDDLTRPRLNTPDKAVRARIDPLVLQAVIRSELAANPGHFAEVAKHPTTVERLVSLYHGLSGVSEAQMAALSLAALPNTVAADALQIVTGAMFAQPATVSHSELVELAFVALDEIDPWARGPIVHFLPDTRRATDRRLVKAVAARADGFVFTPTTGIGSIDKGYADSVAGCGVGTATGVGSDLGRGRNTDTHGNEPQTGIAQRIEVGDIDGEVRAGIAALMEAANTGVPLSRMALLYTTAEPYVGLAAAQLDRAGIGWSGPGSRTLDRSVPARTLIRALNLIDEGLERQAFVTFFSAAPILDGFQELVPAQKWDSLSRRAGVIEDHHWETRLGALAADLRRSAAAVQSISVEGPGGDDSERLLADADEVDRLLAFVARVRELFEPTDGFATWESWAIWAESLLTELLGAVWTNDESSTWPEAEREAMSAVRAIVGQLAGLDLLTEAPDSATVGAVLQSRFTQTVIPRRSDPQGLVVAAVDEVVGLSFEKVVVVGLCEGRFPRRTGSDALLAESTRRAAAPALAPNNTITDYDAWAVAAMAASSAQQPVLTWARGDLSSRRSRSWPHRLESLVVDTCVFRSHHELLADQKHPLSVNDFILRDLIRTRTDTGSISHHPAISDDEILAMNLDRNAGRVSADLNRYNGKVWERSLDPTARPMSPTALENYSACPRRYLLGRVLRLTEEDRPERIDEIGGMDRGTLIHRILETFLGQAISAGTIPEPGEDWTDDDRAQMVAIVEREIRLAQGEGRTGGRVNTAILADRTQREMQQFLIDDSEFRRRHSSTPQAAEMGFGFNPDDPLLIEVGSGVVMKLRGQIDRLDHAGPDGLMVIDYKTGSKNSFKSSDPDPLDGGRRVQLPLYARAAAARTGRDGPAQAVYWFTSTDSNPGGPEPVVLDAEVDSRLDEHLAKVVNGISSGLFPGVPGDVVGWPRLTFDNCKYCEFDRVCPTDRQLEWDDVRNDPALAPMWGQPEASASTSDGVES